MDHCSCRCGSHRTSTPVKKILISAVVLVVLGVVFIGTRLLVDRDEDTWICDGTAWIRHGNPSSPLPTALCGRVPMFDVFFQNMETNPEDCSFVESVPRSSDFGEPTIEIALTELFKGPTPEENAGGSSSVFLGNSTPILRRAFMKDRIVYVDLNDIRLSHSAIGASCGSAAFFSSVEETIRAFYKMAERPVIRYAINGNPEIFYEWVQLGCDRKEGNCDPTPFPG